MLEGGVLAQQYEEGMRRRCNAMRWHARQEAALRVCDSKTTRASERFKASSARGVWSE